MTASRSSGPGRSRRGAGGFLLIEILLAVAIFVVAVIALGRCVGNCITSQEIRNQEERARLALQNAMLEVQASPNLPDEKHQEKLKGMFTGLTLIERRRTLTVENEDKVLMPDLHEITLSVEWTDHDRLPHTKSVVFTLMRGRG